MKNGGTDVGSIVAITSLQLFFVVVSVKLIRPESGESYEK